MPKDQVAAIKGISFFWSCDRGNVISPQLTQVRSATHACKNFDTYFFFERVGKAGFVHSFAGAISICVLVSYDRGQTESSSSTWWGQRPEFLISRMFCPGHPLG